MSSNPTGTIGGVPFEEHNQVNDFLGEALAQYDRTGYFLKEERDTVVAAARNWHTLSNPSNELVERIAKQVFGRWRSQTNELALADVRAVVDALTDTAEEEK